MDFVLVGRIDRQAKAEVRSARRSDTYPHLSQFRQTANPARCGRIDRGSLSSANRPRRGGPPRAEKARVGVASPRKFCWIHSRCLL
jgi:hypothetical protein